MRTNIAVAILTGVLALTSACVENKLTPAVESPPPPEQSASPAEQTASLLEQPDQIPGAWDIKTPQNLPPLNEALSRKVPGHLVYGLYSWAGEYMKYRDDIKAVGWRSMRIAGPFHDSIMTALSEDGMTTMVGLDNWVLDPVKGADRTRYDSDEAFITDYRDKIDAFITRYGPSGTFMKEHPEPPPREIVDIELWNEPNFQYMIPPDGRPQPDIEAAREKLYARMLPEIYQSIKARHPDVNIIAFATGGMSAGDLRFIKNVHALNPEVANSYDTLSTHPYVRPAAPEANAVHPWGSYSISRNLRIIRDTLMKFGRENTPIWFTEIGWPLLPEDGGFYPAARPQECVTPLLQAAYVCRTYAMALRLNVERVHIMFITDADHFNAGFFTKQTKEWRPAAKAVQTMIAVMPDPKLTGSVHDGEDGCYIYTYLADAQKESTPDNTVIMAWNVRGPKTVELTGLAAKVIVTDMLGSSQIRASDQGNLSVLIGPYPVYIQPAL